MDSPPNFETFTQTGDARRVRTQWNVAFCLGINMAQASRFGLRNGVAAVFAVAAIAAGAASQAWAAQITGPGVVTLPDAVVSGFAFATASGSVEDPTDGTLTDTNG